VAGDPILPVAGRDKHVLRAENAFKYGAEIFCAPKPHDHKRPQGCGHKRSPILDMSLDSKKLPSESNSPLFNHVAVFKNHLPLMHIKYCISSKEESEI
jgi:hypothetical protein